VEEPSKGVKCPVSDAIKDLGHPTTHVNGRENDFGEGGSANKTLELPTEISTKKPLDRMKTSAWVSRAVQQEFIDACKICGHNECSVEESLKSAFTQAVKRSILGKPIESYPFKSISITIQVLNITPKYDIRGPKPNVELKDSGLVSCPNSSKKTYAYGNHGFTCRVCNSGGNWKMSRGEPCKVYEKVKYHP
jgi:hypothetical protein